MNKQNISYTDDGHRTTGVVQFFNTLPEHIVTLQKAIPPYIPYEEGHGYLGVMLLDVEKDRVQCHICGRWYKALSAHIKIHNFKAEEYKEEVGLFNKEPLMSLKTLRKFKRTWKEKSGENLKKGEKHKFTKEKNNKDFIRPSGSDRMQWKNAYGTCDAQLKFRLEQAIKKHNKIPFAIQEPKLARQFENRFGSWVKGINNYGYVASTSKRHAIRDNNGMYIKKEKNKITK